MNVQLPQPTPQSSLIHGILSFIVPGSGQFISGKRWRGFTILFSIILLGGLSIWTIAQRARFPDYQLSARIFVVLLGECAALLFFLIAIRHILVKFIIKDTSRQAFSQYGLAILFIAATFLVMDSLLEMAGPEADLRQVYGSTAVFTAASLAALWFWQVADAAAIGARKPMPSAMPAVLLSCLIIFFLGWNITKIDLPKAISEYKDTQIILRRIIWPWAAAFQYDVATQEATARIQAPCPEGETGPAVNEPDPNEPWISVTPTCGELSQRDLRGNFTLGTQLTIIGGNFNPASSAEILWKNPIGNPFRPRGVGETTIQIDENGGFQTTLYIPEAIIPETAVGAQIHTLIVRQESEAVFTWKLSREMNLALIGILETIMLGLMATFFGIILAIPLSFLAARNLMAPISSSLSAVTGGLLLSAVGLILAGLATGHISGLVGGLAQNPLVIAAVGSILVIGLMVTGWKLGASGLQIINEHIPTLLARALTALLFGLIGAAFGYALGLLYSRGFRAIALGSDVASLTESRYTLTGAVLLGFISILYGFYKGYLNEIKIGLIIYGIIRTIMNIVRAIEPLIWALVGIIWVGPGPFAGTIALTLHTIAALGKLYSESIESIDPGPLEAIQATGGTRLQTIMYAVIPQVLPPFISFTIYRWDINVRLSTVIGLVGGGGIGFILIQWIRQFQYEAAGIAVWLIAITVAILDYVSSEIRERFV